ncbi:sulfatase family protein [Parabacteroides sp. ASD2025]|uniref:sulfatase family protein n=1 Tax=Parabacteroides sp. ASD2025 TaxID=3415987 RepID=UPI003CF5DCCD
MKQICRSILGLAVLSSVTVSAQDEVKRPNIIHILMDDVGYDDLSCFGSPDIKTPNIDALAERGMKFTDFYAPHGTSTPSRAALLTGRYAPRVNNGTGLSVLFPHTSNGLEDEEEVCITELLKKQGYRTGLFGKWHLGHLPQYLPVVHGFDEFVGIPYPNDHGPERLGGTGVRPSGISDPAIPLIRQAQIVKECDNDDLGELPNLFRREACKFIYNSVKADKPFYLQYSNIETHTPYFIPRGFEGKSRAGAFGDAVEYLDNTVGIIMDMVRRMKIEDNTWIIITSDNGPLIHKDEELENCYGRFGETDPNREHLLRGGKYQEKYDGGIRVSCIFTWPGVIPAGQECRELTTGMDLFTTMAVVAGAEIPSDRPIDGKNILPLMKGDKKAKSPHKAVFGFRPRGGIESVRYLHWKLIISKTDRQGKHLPVELYDLRKDLKESNNIATQYPDLVRDMIRMGEEADRAIKENNEI